MLRIFSVNCNQFGSPSDLVQTGDLRHGIHIERAKSVPTSQEVQNQSKYLETSSRLEVKDLLQKKVETAIFPSNLTILHNISSE